MLEKFKKALDIMKACWKVLMLDKELLVFPLLTMTILGLLIAGIVFPFWQIGELPDFLFAENEYGEETFNNFVLAGLSFVSYFVTFFVMIFFNSALIACVKIRFAGGDPTVMDGLRASGKRLPQIFAWAFVASSVGWVLSQLKDKETGRPWNFVISLIGAGWAVAAYFVVPVMVSENVGPIDALKRSVSVIKKTWGEALVAEVGFGILYSIIGLILFLLIIATMSLFAPYPQISLSIAGIGVLILFLSSLTFITLGSILKAALYVYAVDGKLPDAFDKDLIKGAFKDN
ncbi:MAG: DUF6159 family protein [Nitratireductor sp.]